MVGWRIHAALSSVKSAGIGDNAILEIIYLQKKHSLVILRNPEIWFNGGHAHKFRFASLAAFILETLTELALMRSSAFFNSMSMRL